MMHVMVLGFKSLRGCNNYSIHFIFRSIFCNPNVITRILSAFMSNCCHNNGRKVFFFFKAEFFQYSIFFGEKILSASRTEEFLSITWNIIGNTSPRPSTVLLTEEGKKEGTSSSRNVQRQSLRDGRDPSLENVIQRVVKVLTRRVLLVYI